MTGQREQGRARGSRDGPGGAGTGQGEQREGHELGTRLGACEREVLYCKI